MITVIQRVDRAAVYVNGIATGSIERGVLVFLGVGKGDTRIDADYLLDKILRRKIRYNNMMDRGDAQSSGIRIDKEGAWYYRGALMFRKDIVNYLSRYLRVDHQGRYLIETEDDSAFVEVEDTPLVVKMVDCHYDHNAGENVIEITMSDGTVEKMDPSTLRIDGENIPYCRVRESSLDARISRPGYYQLAELISRGEGGLFYLPLNGCNYYLKDNQDEVRKNKEAMDVG